MVEENKSISLVILGIVAVIAIVGLVLLFTGARSGATGEFMFGVKEYGGAIKGVDDPYSRAFAGQAGAYYGVIGNFGDGAHQGEVKEGYYGRAIGQIPPTSCTRLWTELKQSGNPQLAYYGHLYENHIIEATQQQMFNQFGGPENCLKLETLPDEYANWIGAYACCMPKPW